MICDDEQSIEANNNQHVSDSQPHYSELGGHGWLDHANLMAIASLINRVDATDHVGVDEERKDPTHLIMERQIIREVHLPGAE